MQHKQTSDQRIVWPAGHSPGSALVFAQNVVEIAASPKEVWSLLIDCIKWPQWYKHCSDVSMLRGGPLLDSKAKFRFKTLRLYFEPEVETFSPCHMLVWSAKGPAGTSGSHAWFIEPTPGGCRVITEEAQKGLVLLLRRSHLRNQLLASHEEWLQSLKKLAEAG